MLEAEVSLWAKKSFSDLKTELADLAAYFSRARQADQAPVVYTEPKHVYKPRGARPGMVIYKQERILWGQPQQGKANAQLLLSQGNH